MTDAMSRGRGPELRAMKAYVEQAARFGHKATLLDVTEFARIPEFDAAFLRLDTHPHGLSFAFSRAAWGRGLRVVDDPRSMRCA